jgi:hypothetical protein
MSTISIPFCRPLFPSLGDDLTIQDANGNIKAGVGIYLLHEWLYGIYVEKITPKGPGMFVPNAKNAHKKSSIHCPVLFTSVNQLGPHSNSTYSWEDDTASASVSTVCNMVPC